MEGGGVMYNTTGCFNVDDDLLNFSLEEEDDETAAMKEHSFSSSFSDTISRHHDDEHHQNNLVFPEFEEELEWLSNKDAFPSVETCLDILSGDPSNLLDHHSPISVLENSSSSTNSKNKRNAGPVMSCCSVLHVPISYPVGKRSKRRRSRRNSVVTDPIIHQRVWLNEDNVVKKKKEPMLPPPSPMMTDNSSTSIIGRRCLHCLADKTPQWRAGPMGPKTLCNACGVRYKSGRLVPEYRPASSPTFSPAAHSNSHRKIVEMRRQKQMTVGGDVEVHRACGYTVG